MYRKLLRPFFFLFSPETAHQLVFSAIKISFSIPGIKYFVKKIFYVNDERLQVRVMGLVFPNPIGLAAGLDKDATLYDELGYLGFGSVEIGTVTPVAQGGNPRPRMFRLVDDEALINRMGFNNEGAEVIAARLKKKKTKIIVGGNIGKNKLTPNEQAIEDYEKCLRELFDLVDYFVVNVSSPNTPNLRELQDKEPLKKILLRLQAVKAELQNSKGNMVNKPLLLKIAPDLSDHQLDDIIEIILEAKLDGVVATNTTVSRDHLKTSPQRLQAIGPGGLSGKPLAKRATEIIRYLKERSNGKFCIIGVGGIHTTEDALEKLNAGADLIQLYTGFIYEGPALIKRINKAILNSKNK